MQRICSHGSKEQGLAVTLDSRCGAVLLTPLCLLCPHEGLLLRGVVGGKGIFTEPKKPAFFFLNGAVLYLSWRENKNKLYMYNIKCQNFCQLQASRIFWLKWGSLDRYNKILGHTKMCWTGVLNARSLCWKSELLLMVIWLYRKIRVRFLFLLTLWKWTVWGKKGFVISRLWKDWRTAVDYKARCPWCLHSYRHEGLKHRCNMCPMYCTT